MLESISISLTLSIVFFSTALLSKNRYSLSRFLYFAYGFSFLLSFIFMITSKEYNVILLPSIYLIFCLNLWISPFGFVRLTLPAKTRKNELKYLFWGILSTIFTIYFAYYSIKSIIVTPIESARLILANTSILPLNIMTYGGLIFQSVYYINIILFFIAIIQGYNSKIVFLLIIGSMSNVFYVLCYFGRDGIVYWILNIIALFMFFSQYMGDDLRKKFIKFIKMLVPFLLLVLIFVTYSRFAVSSNNKLENIASNILEYSGQQLGNFSDSFKYDIRTGSLTPQIDRFTSHLGIQKEPNNIYYGNTNGLEQETNVFGYFIKSLNFILGKNDTFIVTIISFFVIILLCFVSKDISMFIILYTIYQIPLCGLFYYRQSVSYFDISYIVSLIASIFIII